MTSTLSPNWLYRQQKKPGGIENTIQGEQAAQFFQAQIALLRRQKLVDSEDYPADVDEAPDGKDIARRDDMDLETIRDFAGVLPVERQGVGEDIDTQCQRHRKGVLASWRRVFLDMPASIFVMQRFDGPFYTEHPSDDHQLLR
jgi:hypothetical protein